MLVYDSCISVVAPDSLLRLTALLRRLRSCSTGEGSSEEARWDIRQQEINDLEPQRASEHADRSNTTHQEKRANAQCKLHVVACREPGSNEGPNELSECVSQKGEMKFAGVNSSMLSRRPSIVETSAPSGRGITDGPMLTSTILTRPPPTTPAMTAKVFLTTGFMAT